MNEQSTNTPNEETEAAAVPQVDELQLLKERAKILGIPTGNVGVDTLRKKIQDKLEGKTDEKAVVSGAGDVPKTKAQIEQETRERLQLEQMRLVRCRIYNLNPQKNDLRGEIITVGNKYLGTVRKFIPFGEVTDGGYHIPMCIYKELNGKKFQQIRTKSKNGQIEVSRRMVPEYNIEILPPLTKDELEELALQQAAAERLSNE